MPITGIPLPFISYGGSNLVTCFVAVGLVQNVRMRRRATKFDFDIPKSNIDYRSTLRIIQKAFEQKK